MNLNSREIRGLNTKSFFLIDVVFGVVEFSALTAFCYVSSERLPICSFGCLAQLCLGVSLLCTRLSRHFSVVHSVIVRAGDIRLSFKLLLKLERHQNIPRAQASLLVIKI